MKLYRVLVGRVEFGVEVQTDNWFTFLDTTLNAPFSDPIYLGGTFGSLKQGLTTSYAGQAESLWGSATVKFVNSAATLEWNFTYYDKPYSGEKVLFSI
ncbi:hypothetical protein H0H93_003629 [Arthromyces matolae]|nr:hypothetical protein H0H93_003629 [Arthromyces matolae]